MSLLGIRGMETHVMGKKTLPLTPTLKIISLGAKRDLNNFEKPLPSSATTQMREPSAPSQREPSSPSNPQPSAPRYHRSNNPPQAHPNPSQAQSTPSTNISNFGARSNEHRQPQDSRHSYLDNESNSLPRYKRKFLPIKTGIFAHKTGTFCP
jgi:hypothetical protein